MFRPILITGLMICAAPVFADTIFGQARIDSVTIYPGQATVSRDIFLRLPAGRHDIIVPGLPDTLDPQGLRLAAPAGVQIGAVNLARGRLPVTQDHDRPAVVAARAAVEQLEQVMRDRDAAIAKIRLRVQAANDQITFLQSLSQASAAETLTAATIADIQALAQMVGAETLRMRQDAFAAEQEAIAAERARADDTAALQDARQALAALLAPATDGSVLTFMLETATAQDVTITASAIEGFATWSPVYDMRLTTGDDAALTLDRSVVVSQATGQDWLDVKLVLSTARPGEQTAPSPVFSYPRRIISEAERDRPRPLTDSVTTVQRSDLAAPMAEAAPFKAKADFSGATVTYRYPGTVNIRDGVEDLRLPLDTLDFDARVWAEAAPSRDRIAYRMAEFSNTTSEVLLPGQVLIYTDGTMIGFDRLPLLAAGADMQMGFGPLDGLRLTRATPRRSEGDAGVFSRANQLQEAAIIGVENLTGQDWDVLLRDAVPFSEQDDLTVMVTAAPPVTRTNPDGRRGILEWDLRVPAGTKQEVRLDYTLRWPGGFVLE
ncbi:DUF4139 domain-containing protein [Yoonia sp.]|uniref:DUF4139 domain-containing protein n=1 Tax=Yoonia sp. TaxID=2212373 RepID=UPI0019E0BB0D|nr:DUF4139 domain-containing protein [Yoonia sp.]MBE0412362.1 DUF4139 domain-containing protein [Yoonia sp.]